MGELITFDDPCGSHLEVFHGIAPQHRRRLAPAPSGAPVLAGALCGLDCAVEQVVDGGDHHAVIGGVQSLGDPQPGRPLLFYRRAHTVTERAEPTPGVLDNLITWSSDWSRADTWF